MTREEAIEIGIRAAWRIVGAVGGSECGTPDGAAAEVVLFAYADGVSPDGIDGLAVGLTMIAVEVAEIARKRREAAAQTPSVPDSEAFTYERVEVAGPAGDPIWTYERRPLRAG